jgi:hypothetical protein
MEILRQEGSLTTPTILLDPSKGLIELRGKSIPENSFEFYEPLYEWLNEYGEDPKENTQVNLSMEYFNTSSSKEFMKFFKKLEELHKAGSTKVAIKWYHELDDEEMMEMGESLRREVDLPIDIIPIDEI